MLFHGNSYPSHRSIHYNPAVLIKCHTKSTAVFVHTLQDPLLILPRCRRRSEIIPCFDRTYHTGNDPGVLILHLFPVLKSKGLLEDHGVLVLRIPVGSEAEICQTVDNISALVFLDSLQDMGMMTDDQIHTPVNAFPAKLLLIISG